MSANYHFHIENFVNVSNSDIKTAQNIINKNKTTAFDQFALRDIIESLVSIKAQLNLEQEIQQELEADIKTIVSQITLKRPKANIIKACLWSLKSSLENAMSNAIAADLVHRIGVLLK